MKRQTPKFVQEFGYVWCEKLGEIHEDSLDPYDMGGEDKCRPENHYPVYVRRKGETAFRGTR